MRVVVAIVISELLLDGQARGSELQCKDCRYTRIRMELSL